MADQPIGVIELEDVEELITLALRGGALTTGERKNVERIKGNYIAILQKMRQDAQAQQAAQQAAAAEASKQTPTPRENEETPDVATQPENKPVDDAQVESSTREPEIAVAKAVEAPQPSKNGSGAPVIAKPRQPL